MMKQWKILVLLVAGILPLPVSAQKIRFETYTVQDGLVANPVKKIYQDSKGFIWIATWEGLSKYDGHRFTNFTESSGLSSNLVNDVLEMPDGKLLVAENNGCVDVIQHNSVLHKARYKGVTFNTFLVTRKKRIVAGADHSGVYEFRNDSFYRFHDMASKFSVAHLSAWNDSLLVGGHDEMVGFLRDKPSSPSVVLRHTAPLNFLYEDVSHQLWAGTFAGLKRIGAVAASSNQPHFTAPQYPFQHEMLQKHNITAMQEDAHGNYWFGSFSNGLLKVEPGGRSFRYTIHDGLPSNQITCLFRDREHNLWIGTSLGLVKLVTKNNIRFFIPDKEAETAGAVDVNQYAPHNMVVADAKGNIRRFNSLEGRFETMVPTKYQGFAAFAKSNRSLWIVSSNETTSCIGVYNPARNVVINPVTIPAKVYAAAVDQAQHIFAATYSGLFVCPFNKKHLQQLLPFRMQDVLVDQKGYLWAGTWEHGLYQIEYRSVKDRIHTVVKNFTHLLPDRHIRTLFEDRQGNIWIGTRYKGVTRLSRQHNNYTAQHWHQQQGLMTNWISAIAEDGRGNIWLGSYLGLDKLVKQDTGLRVFNFSKVNHFFAGVSAVLPLAGDSIWLATNAGLVHLQDEQTENLLPLPVYITSVAFGAGLKNSDSLLAAKNSTLSHRQNQAAFEFAAPGYINEKQIAYSYRLVGGSDTAWSKPSNIHNVSYASLQPGHYRFEVRTAGWNGDWGRPAGFSFTIQPPYWRATWFIALAATVLATLVYVLFRYRIQQLVRLQKEKSKLQQAQNEQLKAQLEMERVINFFTISLAGKNTTEEVIWDVANNLIHKLGFENCMIYLWNKEKTALLQKAGYGPNGPLEQVKKEPFTVRLWQGIVGHAAATKKPMIVADTSTDPRYRADELVRYSEISVPALHNGELVAVIDSEDFQKNYYTAQHLQILTTIATLMAAKLVTIEANEDISRKKEEMALMKEQMAQLELASLRSQMNPHFLFNSLNSIHKYIWENKQEHASEYLTKFSKLVRMILENSKEKTIPLSAEIEMLHLYIELEHRRCNGKFNYQMTVSDLIKTADVALPSMLIQPFVENAIWHGLVQKEGKGELVVSITGDAGLLECRIEDDGIGRKKAMEIKEAKKDRHASLGLNITQKRLALLQNETGKNASVTIIDKTDRTGRACGTTVILQLPLLNIY
jgi:ligand-binding sensor domain-containing protein